MKTEYDAYAAFLYPYTGEQKRRFFMPSCYAVGAKKALLYAALRARFCREQGFIPNPGKMAFYRVTNPQPKSAKEKSIENLQKSEEGRRG